jgi:hypothetical protein
VLFLLGLGVAHPGAVVTLERHREDGLPLELVELPVILCKELDHGVEDRERIFGHLLRLVSL